MKKITLILMAIMVFSFTLAINAAMAEGTQGEWEDCNKYSGAQKEECVKKACIGGFDKTKRIEMLSKAKTQQECEGLKGSFDSKTMKCSEGQDSATR